MVERRIKNLEQNAEGCLLPNGQTALFMAYLKSLASISNILCYLELAGYKQLYFIIQAWYYIVAFVKCVKNL